MHETIFQDALLPLGFKFSRGEGSGVPEPPNWDSARQERRAPMRHRRHFPSSVFGHHRSRLRMLDPYLRPYWKEQPADTIDSLQMSPSSQVHMRKESHEHRDSEL